MATGTTAKRCTGCGETKPLEEFHRHAGRRDGYSSRCKQCAAEYARSDAAKETQRKYNASGKRKAVKTRYYENHRERLREVWRADQARRRDELGRWLDEIKLAAGCTDCGYADHPRALDFDHIGTDKLGDVGRMVHNRIARAVILAEMAKCEVVCANCHRIRTWKRERGLL